jgi:hypothetical protein
MSCGEQERRKILYASVDRSLTQKLRNAKQTKRCPNEHLNGKTATVCWKCGAPLNNGAKPKENGE